MRLRLPCTAITFGKCHSEAINEYLMAMTLVGMCDESDALFNASVAELMKDKKRNITKPAAKTGATTKTGTTTAKTGATTASKSATTSKADLLARIKALSSAGGGAGSKGKKKVAEKGEEPDQEENDDDDAEDEDPGEMGEGDDD